jgi:hypothetical protein
MEIFYFRHFTNISRSHDRLKNGTESTMAAENLFVNDSNYQEVLETIGERLPKRDVIPALA